MKPSTTTFPRDEVYCNFLSLGDLPNYDDDIVLNNSVKNKITLQPTRFVNAVGLERLFCFYKYMHKTFLNTPIIYVPPACGRKEYSRANHEHVLNSSNYIGSRLQNLDCGTHGHKEFVCLRNLPVSTLTLLWMEMCNTELVILSSDITIMPYADHICVPTIEPDFTMNEPYNRAQLHKALREGTPLQAVYTSDCITVLPAHCDLLDYAFFSDIVKVVKEAYTDA